MGWVWRDDDDDDDESKDGDSIDISNFENPNPSTTSEGGDRCSTRTIVQSKCNTEEVEPGKFVRKCEKSEQILRDCIGKMATPNANENLEICIRTLVETTTTLGQQVLQLQQRDALDCIAVFNPPSYEGNTDPVVLENWIRDIEKIFKVTSCPDNLKIKIGTFYLKKDADNWWAAMEKNYLAEEDFTWDTLKDRLRATFYPPNFKRQVEEEFLNLRQKGMSIQQYAAKFLELARLSSHIVPTDEDKACRFEEGLDFGIQELLRLGSNKTFQEVYNRALNVSRLLQKKDEATGRNKRKKYWDSSHHGEGDKKCRQEGRCEGNIGEYNNHLGSQSHGSRFAACSKCGCNHYGRNCKGQMVCYECNGEGHKAQECPSKRMDGPLGLRGGQMRQDANN